MSYLLLSEEERRRFALHCECEARDLVGLADQVTKLPGMDAMLKVLRMRAAAYRLVARELSQIEEQTIGGVEEGPLR